MLLLVTVGLVLAGLILLIVGFVQDSLTLIYLSIACAAVAGLALIVFSRLSRRRAVTVAAGPVPAASGPPSPSFAGVGPARTAAPAAPSQRSPVAPLPRDAGEPFAARYAEDADEVDEGYDAGEPTAPQPVRRMEQDAGSATTRMEPIRTPAAVGAAEDPAEASDWDEDWGDEVVFPIEDYDDLRVAEILPLLPELDSDELEEVKDREAAGKARGSVLAKIDELLGVVPSAPPAKAPASPKPAPRKAAATKKAAATTAGAAAAKSPTGEQAKAVAKKAPAKTAPQPAPAAAPQARTAKKAPAKAAPAPAPQARTAKKAPAKAAAAPGAAAEAAAAKKVSPAKKAAKETAPEAATAKKATPAKKASPPKTAGPAEKAARKRTPPPS